MQWYDQKTWDVVQRFNREYPPGTVVVYTRVDGSMVLSATTTEATVGRSNSPDSPRIVIKGCGLVPLCRVRPADELKVLGEWRT